ncbi:MAG: PhoU domain-containing protein [Candidatus Poseidoniaceae archaeon]
MAFGPGEIDVRKVQLTGGVTYTLSLPKPWIEQMDLSPRDSIRVDWRPSGALRLTPLEMLANQEKIITIKADDIPEASIHDHLMGAYLAGADSIRIVHSTPGNRLLQRQIRRFLRNTRGFERMNETEGRIDLKCLINAAEMPLNASINRMYSQLTSLTKDIISMASGQEEDLLGDIDEREAEVDALLYLVNRQLSVALDSHLVASALKLTRNQAVEYSNLARSLERMMDHAYQMAQLIEENNDTVIEQSEQPIAQLIEWQDTLKRLMINIRTRNSNEIEECRQALKTTQQDILNFEDDLIGNRKLSKQDLLLFRMAESIRRMCAYARDFGEILLNLKLYDEMIVRN